MNKKLLFALPLMLTGCQSISNGADALGSYLPTIGGEPCHHWQCVTSEGQRISDRNKIMEEDGDKIPAGKTTGQPAAAAPVTPATSSNPAVVPKTVTTTNPYSNSTPYDRY